MELRIANKNGYEIAELSSFQLDSDTNGEKTVEVTVPAQKWQSFMTFGTRVYVPDTEIGGLIGRLYTDTATNTVSLMGRTWRGVLASKIIRPPSGSNYYRITGELNACIQELIGTEFGSLIQVSSEYTVTVTNFKFPRFCTMLEGIEKMLKSVGYRLSMAYRAGDPNGAGYLEIGAVPIVDYSDQIELSQDSRLNFTLYDIRDGVNHLIVGGKGELGDRNIIDLYVQPDGSIGTTRYYTGINEIEYFYENTSTETEELEDQAKEMLEGIMNRKEFQMNVEALDLDVSIGDIIGGRDYITGNYLKKPVENIILTIQDGIISKEYLVEGST